MSDWTTLQQTFQQFIQDGVVPAGYDRDPSKATVESVREYLTARAAGQSILRNALHQHSSLSVPLTPEEDEELRHL